MFAWAYIIDAPFKTVLSITNLFMAQVLEFIGNHYLIVGGFVVLLILFIANEVNRGGQTISSQVLVNLINQGGGVVVDVRTPAEFSEGHIQGALHIPYAHFNDRLAELEPYKDKTVVVVCKIGQSAGSAGVQMRKAGFTDVRRLSGGMHGWQTEHMPVVKG